MLEKKYLLWHPADPRNSDRDNPPMMDPCIFSGFPLDPADHLRGNEAWLVTKLACDSSRFVRYYHGRPLMDISDGLRPADGPCEVGENDWVFMGMDGDAAVFALGLRVKPDLPDHEKFIDLRSVALQLGASGFSDIPSLLGRGKMLLEWNGRRDFCSCCGHKTRVERGGYVRKCMNDDCGAEHFPRTDPVVIMLVTSGDQCLLGRGVGWPEGNYSALAGFMEPGETIEEATRREVLEESGIRVGDVRYVKSQPWPFPSSLMIGVRAAALSTEITIDPVELADARWFEREYLREIFESGGGSDFRIPPNIAIARHLLEEWLHKG